MKQTLNASSSAIILDRRLYLTEDRSRLVEDGDPAARWLYGVKDQRVNALEAARLGYRPLSAVKEEVQMPETKSQEPAEDKAVSKETVSDKAVKPKKKKG